ncbi:hypothetical protein AO239_12390 [Pseudomonas sp. ICMP 19500]|jgi:hypothetical protein|uniref:hypothetical protein n=1 Tax=Pseudomonas TaxID=286 RepID=UPI0006620857|nr:MULTISPECIES: hypothetical protein [Pseudomonas]KTC28003.1 hypothetical protein AO239_12390 [Pseudomonas sp. ICMP 19500]
MKYFIVVALLIACLVSGLAGLTIGINLNSESTTKYVLNWGSMGDWVAGTGAFFAVAVALWQSHVQRKEDVEDLVIEQRQVKQRLVVSVVSRGKRPVRVQWIGFYSKKFDITLPIKSFIFHGDETLLPQTLGYAENIDFSTRPEMFQDLAVNAIFTFDDLDDLQIHVKTTLKEFKKPVLPETKEAFFEAIAMNFHNIRLPLND